MVEAGTRDSWTEDDLDRWNRKTQAQVDWLAHTVSVGDGSAIVGCPDVGDSPICQAGGKGAVTPVLVRRYHGG